MREGREKSVGHLMPDTFSRNKEFQKTFRLLNAERIAPEALASFGNRPKALSICLRGNRSDRSSHSNSACNQICKLRFGTRGSRPLPESRDANAMLADNSSPRPNTIRS